jgi:DNA-binding FrmR family transcriptional regulator
MLDPQQQQAIVTRLNRVEGQIRGIRRMVEEPRLCVEILQQLLQQQQNEALQKWLESLEERYEAQTVYAVGFEPPETEP